jgi:hypothetical protein
MSVRIETHSLIAALSTPVRPFEAIAAERRQEREVRLRVGNPFGWSADFTFIVGSPSSRPTDSIHPVNPMMSFLISCVAT